MEKEKRLVESALFSSGRPVSIKEIKDATGLSKKKIMSALETLRAEYNEDDDRSMEVVKAGEKYAMQLKSDYVDEVRSLAEAEIPPRLLKTLALIAFHQPIKQSELRHMAGPKIYDHVDFLEEKKLIDAQDMGNTELLTTSKLFPEYFGIETTNPDEIREYLADKIGIKK